MFLPAERTKEPTAGRKTIEYKLVSSWYRLSSAPRSNYRSCCLRNDPSNSPYRQQQRLTSGLPRGHRNPARVCSGSLSRQSASTRCQWARCGGGSAWIANRGRPSDALNYPSKSGGDGRSGSRRRLGSSKNPGTEKLTARLIPSAQENAIHDKFACRGYSTGFITTGNTLLNNRKTQFVVTGRSTEKYYHGR